MYELYKLIGELLIGLKIQGQKSVFLDTNCYRLLARKFGAAKTPMVIEKIRRREALHGYVPNLNYIVAGELFIHLGDEIGSQGYQECQIGLSAAIQHINKDLARFLNHPDNAIYHFFMSNDLPGLVYRERSFYNRLIQLGDLGFSDQAILQCRNECEIMSHYFNTLKELWIEATTNTIVKYWDPNFGGGWQIHANNPDGRRKLLKQFINSEEDQLIYHMFSLGIVGYLLNNYPVQIGANLSPNELVAIAMRFRPVFSQQLRILKQMCTAGYNLQKKNNDILDYLMLISLHPHIICISNETRHLVRYLRAAEIPNVLTWNEYMDKLKLPDFRIS